MSDEKKITRQIPTQRTRAQFVADSFNETDRTIDVTFATETAVRTFDWDSYEYVDEILVCDETAGDLSRLNNGGPVLDNHQRWGKTADAVVGVVVSARFENSTGVAKIRFGNTEDDTKLMEKVRDGIVTGVSVGYDVSEYQVTRKDGERPKYRATKWAANEISFTPVQADPNSRTRNEDQNQTHDVVIEDVTEPTEEVSANPEPENNNPEIKPENQIEQNNNNNTEEMENNEKPTEEVLDKTRSEAVKTERDRQAAIRLSVRSLGLSAEFEQTLIDDATVTTGDIARQRAMEEWAKGNPLNAKPNAQQQQTDNEQIRSNMTNALVLRANPAAATVMGEENVRNAGEFRHMSLLRLAEESLKRSNVNTNGLSPRQIAEGAMGKRVRGLHHTTDFPLLLMDTVRRTLLAAYAIQARTFTTWAKRTTLPDFRTITRVRISDMMGELELVREGGEYKYGSFGEGGESYKLDKYGKIIGITWEAIVNDDLSAFSRIPQAFAQKAASKQSTLVYSVLIDNPTMADGNTLFHSTHGNFKGTDGSLTAGGSILSETSLAEGYQAMRAQKTEGGEFIDIAPKFLIVGPKLEFLARKLTSTNYVPTKQTDISVAALTGLIPVVDSRILGNTWFLSADPASIDTVEYAFLDGEEELFMEEREGFNIDGVETKARMVFAAKAIDYRGLYRNNGANS